MSNLFKLTQVIGKTRDGTPLHIVQRGHNREPCLFAEEDYRAYLHWLNEALKAEHCALHAYALMTNHVHLLVTPERAASVPKLIIALGRHYVQYINITYRRTGTLWDSRYKSSPPPTTGCARVNRFDLDFDRNK